MRNNKLYKLLKISCISFAMLTAFNSCIDDDNNINKHEPDRESLEKDNLYVGGFYSTMQRDVVATSDETGNAFQRGQNLSGDIYSGYMASTGTWNGGNNNATYNLYYDDWNDVAFNLAYNKVMVPWNEIKKEYEAGRTSLAAYSMTQLVKIEAMHRITDAYGPIPYSKFGQGGIKVAYDAQEDIYRSFISELTVAINELTMFSDDNPGDKLLAPYDDVYGGNVINWIKFGNTLKLRLAMRMYYADAVSAKQFAEEAVAHRYGLITVKDEAAKLQGSGIFNPLQIVWDEYADTRMSANMDSYLNGYADPRISHYFQASSVNFNAYAGVRNGITISSSLRTRLVNASTPNIFKTDPVLWMSAAESYFLRAEGAMRGWNMGGTDEDFYNDGIRTSMAEYGISGPTVDNYLTDTTLVPIRYQDYVGGSHSVNALSTIAVTWDPMATNEVKQERIITQKWIAMFPDGMEAWAEYRRTGYPKLFPVKVNLSAGSVDTNIQIRRLIYPRTERDNNAENLDAALLLLGGPDTGGSALWWDKK